MFDIIDRPPRNRRHIKDEDMDWDLQLETELRETFVTQRAIRVPLWLFHSSPAKGRLWKDGLAVRHRVLPDRQYVGAWIEKIVEPPDIEVGTQTDMDLGN